MSSHSVNATNEFSTILTAAFLHPHAGLRSRLQNAVHRWVPTLGPLYSPDTIERSLKAESGTALEPFRLSASKLLMVKLGLQAAFSEAMNVRHVRLVGEDSLSNRGGLVLGRDLKARYCERYALGNARVAAKDDRLPMLAPAFPLKRAVQDWRERHRRVRTICAIGDDGLRITISGLPQQEAESTSKWSTSFFDSGQPLSSLGVAVEERPGLLVLIARSTETLIRMSAQMEAGSIIVASDGISSAFVLLRYPERESVDFSTILLGKQAALAASVPSCSAPDISVADQVSTARWLPPPASWMRREFLETWYETFQST